MLAKLIATAQRSARIVLGADATPAETFELTESMGANDWRDLADTAGLPRPALSDITAARAYLRLAAEIDREAGLLAL